MSAQRGVLAVMDEALRGLRVAHDGARTAGARESFAEAHGNLSEARATVAEFIEAARKARPAGEVGWPSAYLLEPADAARFRDLLARMDPQPGEQQ